jgi:hemolysin III
MLWLEAPQWLSLSLYLGMGWLVVLAIQPLYQHLSKASLAWMVAGGLAYTVGAVFYGARWPNPWPRVFGHHEIWHVFVLTGSSAHFLAVLALL